MNTFEELFIPIYHALLEMKENYPHTYSNETSSKAESFFKLVDDFDFIVSLIITRNILDYLLPVTRKLQQKEIDIAKSLDLIRSLKRTCSKLRKNIEESHTKWYSKAVELASKVDIKEKEIKKPRTCSKQIHRPNQPVTTPSDYYRVSLTLPLIDHLISDLEAKFPGNELTAYCGLFIVPEIMLASEKIWRREFLVFVNFYCEDLPSFSCLDSELDDLAGDDSGDSLAGRCPPKPDRDQPGHARLVVLVARVLAARNGLRQVRRTVEKQCQQNESPAGPVQPFP